MIYTITVTTDERTVYTLSYFGKGEALDYAYKAASCDNVFVVEVVSDSTGEVLLTMRNGKAEWVDKSIEEII